MQVNGDAPAPSPSGVVAEFPGGGVQVSDQGVNVQFPGGSVHIGRKLMESDLDTTLQKALSLAMQALESVKPSDQAIDTVASDEPIRIDEEGLHATFPGPFKSSRSSPHGRRALHAISPAPTPIDIDFPGGDVKASNQGVNISFPGGTVSIGKKLMSSSDADQILTSAINLAKRTLLSAGPGPAPSPVELAIDFHPGHVEVNNDGIDIKLPSADLSTGRRLLTKISSSSRRLLQVNHACCGSRGPTWCRLRRVLVYGSYRLHIPLKMPWNQLCIWKPLTGGAATLHHFSFPPWKISPLLCFSQRNTINCDPTEHEVSHHVKRSWWILLMQVLQSAADLNNTAVDDSPDHTAAAAHILRPLTFPVVPVYTSWRMPSITYRFNHIINILLIIIDCSLELGCWLHHCDFKADVELAVPLQLSWLPSQAFF